MDYKDKDQVIDWAKKLNKRVDADNGTVVFKHPERDNYNITHMSRTDRYKGEWVVWKEQGGRRENASAP